MPVARIAMLKGKSDDYIRRVADALHAALTDAFEVEPGDRFQIVDQYEPGTLIFDRDFATGGRSDDFLLITLTAGARPREVKEAFYKRLAGALERACGIRPEDVMVVVTVIAGMEDLSFGRGLSTATLLERLAARRQAETGA